MANWTAFEYSIQIEARDYVEVVQEKAIKEIQLRVTEDTVMMQTAPSEVEMAVGDDSEALLQVAPDEIEMAVADDEVILPVDAEEET